MKKILIMGLPGSGKTTLAVELARRLNAVHFNADEVRREINSHLGFSVEDRIEHARRMGWLADQVVKAGHYAIADFVCPTQETRSAFGDAYIVWVNRIKQGRYEDTNVLFEPPTDEYDIMIEARDGPMENYIGHVYHDIMQTEGFDPKKPTVLLVGRYQPPHAGHLGLVDEGLRRVGQVCIAVRDTEGTDEKNPFSFEYIKAKFEELLQGRAFHVRIIKVPNISDIFYGRDVGYNIEQIDLPQFADISASKIRKDMGI